VVATHVDGMPEATVCGVLQLLPPLADDVKPTASWVLPAG
jgi:hypothetical protein